jgi:hypothetical protein
MLNPKTRCNGLKNSFWNGKDMCFPRDILEVCGPTLTSLVVHVPEPYDPERRPDISLADLQWLKEKRPKLKTLGVDMNLNGQWVGPLPIPNSCSLSPRPANAIVSQLTTNPALRLPVELATFPSRAHLTLATESRRGGNSPVIPIVDRVSKKYLFEFLRTHKAGQPLLSLTIQRGGMASRGGGYPASCIIEERKFLQIGFRSVNWRKDKLGYRDETVKVGQVG